MGTMSDANPRGSLAARRAVSYAEEAAEFALAAKRRSAALAAREECKARTSSRSSMRHLHLGLAAAARRNEDRQRAAARIQLAYAHRLEEWIERRNRDTPRPSLMSGVIDTTAARGAVLSVCGDGGVEYLVTASDDSVRRTHELEVSLGEGPSQDAMRGASPAARDEGLERRWPRYGSSVRRWGVTAVAAAPLTLGDRLHGALTVIDPPEPQQVTDYREVNIAAAALDQVLLGQPGASGLHLFEEADFQPALHAASGVVVSRAGLRFDEAVVLIREHAHAHDRPVADVAAEINRGTLTLP